MAFHDVQFPVDVSYGTTGWPEHNVKLFRTPSGSADAVNRWSAPIRHWSVNYGIKSYAQLRTVYDFFLCREGATHTFRYKDWWDYTTNSRNPDQTTAVTATDQEIGVGDGATTDFVLTKRYVSGPHVQYRNISLPVVSTVLVSLDNVTQGSGWQIVISPTGQTVLRFTTAPALGVVVKWGGEFDCHARFSEDTSNKLDLSLEDFSTGSYSNQIVIDEELGLIQTTDDLYTGHGTIQTWLSGTLFWVYTMGSAVMLNPGASCTFSLPEIAKFVDGGPHFYLVNVSANTVTVDSPSLNSSFTLAANKGCQIFAITDGSSRYWVALAP